ncbi:MAG: hypothetical protein J6L87_02730 [Clostridia bacterium]|nr:hypothetical protein [Clostridia bacterium]
MGAKRFGLLLYFDQRPLLDQIPARDFKKFVLGLLDLAANGTEPEPLVGRSGALQEFFVAKIKQSAINAANGQKGGLKAHNRCGTTVLEKAAQSAASSGGLSGASSLSNKVKINEVKLSEGERASARTPTREEVDVYCREKGYPFAAKFYAHYQAKLWEGVRDFRAKADEWHLQDKEKAEAERGGQGSFDVDDFFEAALRKTYAETGE